MEMIENGMVVQGEEEEIVVTHCDYCGCEIYEGDDYYNIDGEEICEDCISGWLLDYRKTAERE